jgi:type IV secretory pathway TrbF-like protein
MSAETAGASGQSNGSAKSAGAAVASSPYADAKRFFIGVTGEDRRWASIMTRVAVLSLAGLAASMALNFYLASQPRLVPMFFREDASGTLTPVGRGGTITITQSSVRAAVARWLVTARSVTSDPTAQKEWQREASALIARNSAAQTALMAYWTANPPLELGALRRISVAIAYVSPLSASDHTYEAEWTETWVDPNGRSLGTHRYHGVFTIGFSTAPRSEQEIYDNPLGLYITSIDWPEKVN